MKLSIKIISLSVASVGTVQATCVATNSTCGAGCWRSLDSINSHGIRTCGEVPPGFYSPTNSDAIFPCEVGFYNDKAGSSKCKPCPPGTYSADSETIECLPCASGTYNNFEGVSECETCDPAIYSGTGSDFVIWLAGTAFCVEPEIDEPTMSPTFPPIASPAPTMSPTMSPSEGGGEETGQPSPPTTSPSTTTEPSLPTPNPSESTHVPSTSPTPHPTASNPVDSAHPTAHPSNTESEVGKKNQSHDDADVNDGFSVKIIIENQKWIVPASCGLLVVLIIVGRFMYVVIKRRNTQSSNKGDDQNTTADGDGFVDIELGDM